MTSFDDLYAEIEAEASAAGSVALRDLKQKIDKYSAASRADEWNKGVSEVRALLDRLDRLRKLI